MADKLQPGRRPDGHQHAGHGRHRRDREALGRRCRRAAVVMMSVQGEADYLRRSMLAGAREFLVKPFSSDELTASIRQVYTRERDKQSRIARDAAAPCAPAAGAGPATRRSTSRPGRRVFSPKGGVGRTTVAVNLAVAAATELGKSVVLVDGSFQFGDVGVLLNLNPKNKSIADLVPELEAGELESHRHVRHQPLGRDPRPARPALAGDGRADHPGRRASGSSRRSAATTTSSSSTARRGSTTRRSRSSTSADVDPDDAQPRDHEHQEHAPLPRGRRPARLRGRTRSSSSSTGPTRASGSASPTSRARSAGRSTTRSSATAGPSCTPSTGAYRSSSPTGRRRSPRTSSGWPSRSPGSGSPAHARTARKTAQKKSLFSFR